MKNICVKVLSKDHGKFNIFRNTGSSTVITIEELQAMAKPTFKRGERVLVWNGDSKDKVERIFLAHIPGLFHPYYVVSGTEEENFTKFEAGEKVDFCIQNYIHCEKIQPLPTLQDLCNQTKLTKDQLKKIINNEK